MRHIVFLIFVSLATLLKAQNLSLYFELIPESQLPQLKADMRKGMVGMYELGQRPASVPNLLNGTCTLDTLSNDYLLMHTSRLSTLAIKMLPDTLSDSHILVVIHTVQVSGTEDSSLAIFTNTWSKLDVSQYLTLPTHKDFYQENEKVTLEDFENYCRPLLIAYHFEGDSLVASIDPERYLTIEQYKNIEPALKKKLLILP